MAAILSPDCGPARDSGGLSSPGFFSLEGNEGPADRVLSGGFSWREGWYGQSPQRRQLSLHPLFHSGPCVLHVSLVQISVASRPRVTCTQIPRETPRVSCTWLSASHVPGGSRMFCRSQLWVMHVEGPSSGPEVACARARSVEGHSRKPGVRCVGAASASGGTVCGQGTVCLGVVHVIDPVLEATLSCLDVLLVAVSSIKGWPSGDTRLKGSLLPPLERNAAPAAGDEPAGRGRHAGGAVGAAGDRGPELRHVRPPRGCPRRLALQAGSVGGPTRAP